MGQLKKMFAVLLPVFWLVTFVACPFASSLACVWPADCASASSPAGDTQAGDPSCASDDLLRWDVRRHGVVRIPADQPPLGLFSTPPSIPVLRIAPEFPPTDQAFLLQQRWQFVWRTADSPRAPSFLA
jgi:hypothetical protein